MTRGDIVPPTTLPRPVGFVLGGGGSLGAIQVGMLQALADHGITPDLVPGTSVGSINGAVVAHDPVGAANRLSHAWARARSAQVFPGGLLGQVRTLRQTKTNIFPNTGLAAMIQDFLGPVADYFSAPPMLPAETRAEPQHRALAVANYVAAVLVVILRGAASPLRSGNSSL